MEHAVEESMKISKSMIIVIIFLFANLVSYIFYERKPETLITNELKPTSQLQAFPSAPTRPIHPPEGVQVVRSILGLEVTFLKGNVNYPGLMITNDPRYQALASNEKLVDALRFQSLQGPSYFLLIAIAKNPNGTPLIVPGKFNFVQNTEQGGLILTDLHGRLFYYSGYLMTTPGWKNLAPGQMVQDHFCKVPAQVSACSSQNTVKVVLKKPVDPNKDIPLLTLVR